MTDRLEKNCKGLYKRNVFIIINICLIINSVDDLNNLEALVGELVLIGTSPINRSFSFA